MPPKRYTKGIRMSDAMVLDLFDTGVYRWDEEECKVFGRDGELYRFSGGRSVLQFVRLYRTVDKVKYYRAIAIHRLSWILGSRSVIPVGWQVHHRDKDQLNNLFSNLVCVHSLDHRKLHEEEGEEDEIPF